MHFNDIKEFMNDICRSGSDIRNKLNVVDWHPPTSQ